MERIVEILHDPKWWFTAVFIAIVASLIGALIKDALLNGLAKISKSYRVRKQKRDKDLEDEINTLITNPSLLILRFCEINHSALLTVFISIVFLFCASIIFITTTNENKGIIFYMFMCLSIISGVLSIIRCYKLLPQIHIMYTTYNKYRKKLQKSLPHQTASGNSKNNNDNTSCLSNLSDVARDILKCYLSSNATQLHKNIMLHNVSNNRIKIEAALDELLEAELLFQTQERVGEDMVYLLTGSGTKYLADGLLSDKKESLNTFDSKINHKEKSQSIKPKHKDLSEPDILALLTDYFSKGATRIKESVAIRYSDVDDTLNLPPGSTKKYIIKVVGKRGYHPVDEGEEYITFTKNTIV